jgi:hypothetical protein
MLNMPQRNANATASAVRISGVVISSVCCKSLAAGEFGSHGISKNHVSPVPSKMAL